MLSAADWGTLAAEQWVNGRRSFANPRLGTLSFSRRRSFDVGRLGCCDFGCAHAQLRRRALDRSRSRGTALHGGARGIVVGTRRRGARRPHWRSEGDRRAGARVGRRTVAELRADSCRLCGEADHGRGDSFATAGARHAARSYAGDTVTEVAGINLRKGFANEANGCSGEIGFTDFLRCSSNQYAAELMVRSLQQDGWASRGKGALVPRATLERSTIATGLAEVFDVDAYANRTPGRLGLYWSSDSGRVPSASSRDDGS